MKKKKIIAAVLALTMVMPMTAMADQKPIPLGEFIEVASNADGSGFKLMQKYEVVDAATFYAVGNTVFKPPIQGIQLAVASMGDAYETYYINGFQYVPGSEDIIPGWTYGFPVIEIDGQLINDRTSGINVTIDASGRWWTEDELEAYRESVGLNDITTVEELEAFLASGKGITSLVSGTYWPITIDGQSYRVVNFRGGAGKVWIVPKAATNVRVLSPVTGYKPSKSGFGTIPYDDYDNAYYIDLKIGTTTSSATQLQTSEDTAVWKSDAKGWWVERADGTYLQNKWYESNGQWYYMGADGYMLTNTTTPDGYMVNADGVRVE